MYSSLQTLRFTAKDQGGHTSPYRANFALYGGFRPICPILGHFGYISPYIRDVEPQNNAPRPISPYIRGFWQIFIQILVF